MNCYEWIFNILDEIIYILLESKLFFEKVIAQVKKKLLHSALPKKILVPCLCLY